MRMLSYYSFFSSFLKFTRFFCEASSSVTYLFFVFFLKEKICSSFTFKVMLLCGGRCVIFQILILFFFRNVMVYNPFYSSLTYRSHNDHVLLYWRNLLTKVKEVSVRWVVRVRIHELVLLLSYTGVLLKISL